MRAPVGLLVGCLAFAACDRGPPPGSPAAYAMELQSLKIRNLVMSDDLRIMCAGQLTEEQLGKMPYFGYDTVIALREASEDGTGWEETYAKRNGIDFVRIPVGRKVGITRANAELLDAAIPEQGCVTIYCGSGDRVGGLMALRAHFVQGESPIDALAIGKAHGMTKSTEAVQAALGLPH